MALGVVNAPHQFQRSPASVRVLLIVECLASRPAYLGHFSWLIGGSAVGHRIRMVGEDWAQDAGELARVVKEQELLPLYYVPYGMSAVPEVRRAGVPVQVINCRKPPEGPGWVAIHAAVFLRASKGCAGIPPERPPDVKVREHVWLWRVEAPGPEARP